MTEINLAVPPVAAKLFAETPEWVRDVETFRGVSFCEAVSAAGGRELWVDAASLGACRWSPVVLGLAAPEIKFQQEIEPRLPLGTAGIYLAPLARFRADLTPDVVLVRAGPEELRAMAEAVGWDHGAWPYVEEKRIAVSALRALKSPDGAWRSTFTRGFNRVLGAMLKAPGWKPLTIYVFKNRQVSAAFEAFIKRTLASMSVCRNSLVIPHVSGQFNISYLCAGGVSWGGNYPFFMTSGWPWALWQTLHQQAVVRA